MLRDKTAQKIASYWHDGQWSALYSFASTGKYLTSLHLQYLKEIEDSLHPEYALYPGTLSNKQFKELTDLKDYILKAGEINCITTEYHSHPVYGYLIPFIKNAPENILNSMGSLRYPV